MILLIISFFASIFGAFTASSLDFLANLLNVSSGPFSGIISFWPFIVALVVLLLAIMWYQNIKSMQRRRKTSGSRPATGINSMVFMGVVTVFVAVLLASPWYLENLAEKNMEKSTEISPENRTEVLLTVHGMDCGGCESLVQQRVGALEGVESVIASHIREETYVVFDKSKVDIDLIAQTIEESGYTVIVDK